jgi:hypothetical protein
VPPPRAQDGDEDEDIIGIDPGTGRRPGDPATREGKEVKKEEQRDENKEIRDPAPPAPERR